VFAAEFAAAGGAHVVATSSDDGKLDSMRQLGASVLINYKATPNRARRCLNSPTAVSTTSSKWAKQGPWTNHWPRSESADISASSEL